MKTRNCPETNITVCTNHNKFCFKPLPNQTNELANEYMTRKWMPINQKIDWQMSIRTTNLNTEARK